MVALASTSQNEALDQYLMCGDKLLDPIKTGETFQIIFAQKCKNHQDELSLDDFNKIKVIGQGGFAEKVYLARKKDTG